MNELARPTLQVDLDVEIPKIPVLEHNLKELESFATELSTFYNELLDDNALSVKDIKAERTKVRKIMTTIADNRKKTVKAYKEPIQDFEDTSKRIEKVLKTLDDRMKSIVDADKLANEDPFAGLSINQFKVILTCNSKEQVKLIKEFAKANNIDMEEI